MVGSLEAGRHPELFSPCGGIHDKDLGLVRRSTGFNPRAMRYLRFAMTILMFNDAKNTQITRARIFTVSG